MKKKPSDLEVTDESQVIRRVEGRIGLVSCLTRESGLHRHDTWSSVEEVIEAHGWVSVHELSLQARWERDFRLNPVHLLVRRFEASFDNLGVGRRLWRCVEVTHEEDLVGGPRPLIDPEKRLPDLHLSHILVCHVELVVQVGVHDHDIALLSEFDLDHLRISDSAQV